ncbi:dienelactone hydrolase family protein [Alkalihalobacillus trypoxylicola]|uniref:Dienelactone hydrolase n=1 Tax=Alkalihalobacillus trypoxylicola TaxID=519424 RepID=A0A162F2Z2_9BACI|nr:alpha/beta hydrolase family protein [Alkalihalobacillus trypoxylicola]KYG34374.1 hypothetical protein AZF04_14380 [Alkalihalobacillus trypoxylicola]
MNTVDHFEQAFLEKTIINQPKMNKAELISDLKKKLVIFENPYKSVELVETTQIDDFIREKVLLHSSCDLLIPMYILTPIEKESLYPAVLAMHGHGYGHKEAVGLTKEGKEEKEPYGIHQRFAVQLVKQGFKVFVPEILGFGERILTRDKEAGNINSCNALAKSLLMGGRTLAGMRVEEALEIYHYIKKQEDVDGQRTGVIGFSGGALISNYTSILEPSIKATVLTGFTNTFSKSILAMHHCIDNYIPGLLKVAELPQLISLIAPRNLFVEAGTHDRIFPKDGVQEAIKFISKEYQSQNKETHFQYHLFNGAHEINGEKAFPWLKQVLG